MKKMLKSRLFFFILGAITLYACTVLADALTAETTSFTPTDNTWKNEDGSDIDNVQEALDYLYESGKLKSKCK